MSIIIVMLYMYMHVLQEGLTLCSAIQNMELHVYTLKLYMVVFLLPYTLHCFAVAQYHLQTSSAVIKIILSETCQWLL